MASSIEDFEDILSGEPFSGQDMAKLRAASYHGIPAACRAKVWLLLLQATQKVTNFYSQQNTDPTTKRLRAESERYQRSRRISNDSCSNSPSPSSSSTTDSSSSALGGSADCANNQHDIAIRTCIESTVSHFLSIHTHVEYSPFLVTLAGPFVYCGIEQELVYPCFESLYQILEQHFTKHSLEDRVSSFLMLFRILMPSLYSHLEDEEVSLNDWATQWFSSLLARQLPIPCVQRLWDTYFSTPEGIGMHVWVCLAILDMVSEGLEECEGVGEVGGVLGKLPWLDMDQVIGQALNFRNLVGRMSVVDVLES